MKESIIVKLLNNVGLIDYWELSSSDNIPYYKENLDSLLSEAESRFEELIRNEEISFSQIVENYLNNDELFGMLYEFLNHLNSVNSSEQTREIIQYFQPKYVAFNNKTTLSKALYDKFTTLRDSKTVMDDEQLRSLSKLIQDMEMAGVHLEEDKKKNLQDINLNLARLSEDFSNHVIDSKQKFFHQFDEKDSIKEMPQQDLEMAKNEAKRRNLEGWVFTLSPPSIMAIMKYCSDRNVRKKFYENLIQVATKGKDDNQPLAMKILKLRKEKAKLLGKKNYAEYVLQDRMADSIEEVEKMLNEFAKRARVKGKKDLEELKFFANLDDLQPWDVAFYSNKLKCEKFKIDEKELKKYFPLKKVINGMFEIAKKLYGLEFQQLSVESYHEDVISYKVLRDGNLIAYFIVDLFARPEKRPGAWCNILRSGRRSKEGRQTPIVINVSNFGKSDGEIPTLLSHIEVITMFHEFGHGIHMMLSENNYANTGSMSVEWDFVELPSQLMENWCWEKASLDLFAEHYESKKPLPNEIVNSLNESQTFMSGFNLLRQNEFGFLDMELHKHSPFDSIEKMNEFCLEISRKYSLLDIPNYYRMYASFSHIFAGGYAAGYYSYLWAEILEADVFERFKKEGLFNSKLGEDFRVMVLAAGASRTGKELFQNFMGRAPDLNALLKKKGMS